MSGDDDDVNQCIMFAQRYSHVKDIRICFPFDIFLHESRIPMIVISSCNRGTRTKQEAKGQANDENNGVVSFD